MFFSKTVIASLAVLSGAQLALAHGKLAVVSGTNGATGQAFALTEGTCGGPSVKCEGDTTVFARGGKRAAIMALFGRATATAGCGKTKNGGQTDCAAALALAEKAGPIASCSASGEVTMTLHQVNADGAGPYSAFVNTDGTGQTWTSMAVTKNVPGTFGLSGASNEDFQVSATMPAGTKCTGGADGQTCLVRMQNPIGPFGGVAAVTQNDGGAAKTTKRNVVSIAGRALAHNE